MPAWMHWWWCPLSQFISGGDGWRPVAPEEGARTAQEEEEEEEEQEEEGFGRKRCRKLGHLTPAPHSAPILLLFTPQIHTGCVSRNRHHLNFKKF